MRRRHVISALAAAAAVLCVTTAAVGATSPRTPASIAGRAAAHGPSPVEFQAWLYPAPRGDPECAAAADVTHRGLAAGTVKVEYLDFDSRGQVVVNGAGSPSNACNGYSPANAAYLRARTANQYITVTVPSHAAERTLTSNPAKVAAGVRALTSFAVRVGFSGIDVDFENFWVWSGVDARNYYTFISALAHGLHAHGLTLQVDGPGDLSTPFNFGRVLAAGADQVVMMDYDYQDPSPVASTCPPITPLSWLRTMVRGALREIPASRRSRLVVGLPSYGYVASDRCQRIEGSVFFDTMRSEPGFASSAAEIARRRDGSSGEIRWHADGRFFDYVDQVALDRKLAVVVSLGVTKVSVWDLGGDNPWFAPSVTH